MSVAARSNDFGVKTYYDSCVETTTTFRNGVEIARSQRAYNVFDHICARNYHSKNPSVLIPGTTTRFRSPSTYNRNVVDYSYQEGIWIDRKTYASSNQVQERRGIPKTLLSSDIISIPPQFSGHALVTEDTNLKNQSVTECLLRLNEAKVQLGADMAEAAQTVDMLADSAKTLWSMLKLVKQRKFHLLPSALKHGLGPNTPVSNMVLQWKFGWQPLCEEIYGLNELLKEQMKPAMIFSATRNVSDYGYVTSARVPGWDISAGAERVHTTKLWARPDGTWASQVHKFGIDNPASILWEVVPYSFVVDWGLPIGNVLQALTAAAGLVFVGGYTAVRGEGRGSARMIPGGNWEEVSPRTLNFEHFSYGRTKLGSWPRPLPYAKAKSPFTTTHVLEALALHSQITR